MTIDLTEPERLALAYIVDVERQTERGRRREKLDGLLAKLLASAELTNGERADLAYRARREIETNRYPLAPQLGPLKSAFAKLSPADEPPKAPVTPRRKTRR